MKKKILLPQLTVPVIRTNNTSSVGNSSIKGAAAQHSQAGRQGILG